MMNDEIKEILDKLRETADYPKINYSSYDKSYNETIDNVAMIKSFACKQLLDYITNLEQVNKNQAKRNSRQRLANQKQQELILKLQQENEHLRTDLNTFKNTIIEVNKECNSLLNHLTKKDLDYKSRCEKAIEYIKYNDSDLYTFEPDYDYEENLVDNYEPSSFREDLLNILQNGSNDND